MIRNFVAALWLAAFVATIGFAQTPTGTLQGTVVDPSGAAVGSARVRIVNNGTSVAKELTTDGNGRYVQPLLNPGLYTIEVEASGFAPAKQENIKLDVSQIYSADFKLTVGTVSSKVDVQATVPPLDSSNATLGQVIDTRTVIDLPLNGRNPFSLAQLVPGVNNVGNASTPHIGGSRNAVSEEQIDGVTNILPENNVGNTSAAYTPIVDSVNEFSVQTNALSAEYGRFGGGVINVVTKSGTNEWHGGAFAFARNGILNANDFFANRSGSARPDMHRYQYGGTLGGPILIPKLYDGRNRTFFFFGFEETKEADNAVETDTVPTVAQRAGDFSAPGNPVIYDPSTIHTDASGALVRSPFAGNRLPGLSPIGLNVINYFPLPNTGAPGALVNNYVVAGVSNRNDDHWDSRFDHNFTEKWHMFLRVSHDWNDSTPLNNYGNAASSSGDGPAQGGAWSASMDHTISFTPTLIGDFRYGISRSYVNRVPYGAGFDISSLGLPSQLTAVAGQLGALAFPRFEIQNTSGLGNSGWVFLTENPLAHDATASITKVAGSHTVKVGAEYRKLFINFTQFGLPDGQFGIGQGWTQQNPLSANGTGSSYATLLLGLTDYANQTYDSSAASSNSYWAGYIQDDWKVSRKLTINLGLRYEVERPRTERYNQLSYWDPSKPSPLQGMVPANACLNCGDLRGQMLFVNQPGSSIYGRSQAPIQWKDWGPRVGIAYSPTSKMVIRSGFGIAYLPSPMQAAGSSGAAGTQGFSTSTYVNGTTNNYVTANNSLANPFPQGFILPQGPAGGPLTQVGNGIDQSFFDSYRMPYTMQWNFNIQRELPGGFTAEVGYLGNRSLFLVDGDPGRPYNQVSPSYLSLGDQLISQVANPFYGIITGSAQNGLNSPTVPYYQLLEPFPQYSNVTSFRKPNASSMYHAFTTRINKRYSNGLSFLLSFTAAKGMDDSAAAVTYLGPNSGTRADQYNRRLEWAVSPQDISRSLVASFTYDLPFGKGKAFANSAPRFVNGLIGGWQVNGIITWQTGTPIVLMPASYTTGLNTLNERPDNNGQSAAISNQNINHWFNTSVFSTPAPFTIGSAGRTLPDVRNPGIANADLSLFKNNRFGHNERYNVQFRLEAFNALNHPLFAAPDTNINDSNFGIVTSTNGNVTAERQVQLALKFLF
jgi:hypothetical protein